MSGDKSCPCSSEIIVDASLELSERCKRIATDVISALNRAGVAAKIVFPEAGETASKGAKTSAKILPAAGLGYAIQ